MGRESDSPLVASLARLRRLNREAAVLPFIERVEEAVRELLTLLGGADRSGSADVIVDVSDLLIATTTIEDRLDELSRRCSGPVGADVERLQEWIVNCSDEAERRRADRTTSPDRDRMREAVPWFERELDKTRKGRRVEDVGTALYHLGWICDELGWHARSLRYHREAVRLYERAGDPAGRARNLQMVGVAYRRLRRHDDAIVALRSATDLAAEAGNRELAALCAAEMASVLEARGRFAEAFAGFEAALGVFEALADTHNAAMCRAAIARIRGRADAGTVPSPLPPPPRDPMGAVPDTLLNTKLLLLAVLKGGRLLEESGDWDDALRHYALAAEDLRRRADSESAGVIECCAAHVLILLGRPDEAAVRLRSVLDTTATAGDSSLQLSLLCTLGEAERVRANYREAVEVYGRALLVAERASSTEGLATVLTGLGSAQHATGDIPAAVRTLRRAAEIALHIERDDTEPSPRCDAFWEFGNILRTTGRPEEALVWHHRAVKVATASEDPLALANAHRELGNTYLALDQNLSAVEALTLAVRFGERASASVSQASALQLLAIAHLRYGALDEALATLDRSEEQASRAGERTVAASLAATRATTLAALGRHVEARQVVDAAIDAVRELGNPRSLADLRRVSAHIAHASGDWSRCRADVRHVIGHLATQLEEETSQVALGTVLQDYISVFEVGVRACEAEWGRTGDRRVLEQAVECADAAKCVAIREGMRRHRLGLAHAAQPAPWRAGPTDWQSLFHGAAPAGVRHPARGARERLPAVGPGPLLEFGGSGDHAKNRFCDPVSFARLHDLIPDDTTVLVNLFLDGDDIVVLPVSRARDGTLDVACTPTGLLRCRGVRESLTTVMQRWRGMIDERLATGRLVDAGDLATELHDLVGGTVLDALSAVGTLAAPKHLVLVTDSALAGAPLHAARHPRTGQRLMDQVASVRYALSLRTLDMLLAIERERAKAEDAGSTLRGVGFAWPDRQGFFLPGVIAEVEELVAAAGPEAWRLCGEVGSPDDIASRETFRALHRTGNLGWFMGHGAPRAEDHVELDDGSVAVVREPSLVLSDGALSVSRMVTQSFDYSHWRLFHIGACLMGQLDPVGQSKELQGYIATLTMLHCRRITSALWELDDHAAAAFAREFAGRLAPLYAAPSASPHGFAIAFREAVLALRSRADERFAHEFFWAPLLFHGLG